MGHGIGVGGGRRHHHGGGAGGARLGIGGAAIGGDASTFGMGLSRHGRIGFTTMHQRPAHWGLPAPIPNAICSLDMAGHFACCGLPGANCGGKAEAVDQTVPIGMADIYTQQEWTELIKKIEAAYDSQ
jgi:hypothetical protein